MLLAKAKLHAIEVLTSKALINTYINHEKFVSVNNVLREHTEMKEVIENQKNFCVTCNKNTENKNISIQRTK